MQYHEIELMKPIEHSIGERWVINFVKWFTEERDGELHSALQGPLRKLDSSSRQHTIWAFMQDQR